MTQTPRAEYENAIPALSPLRHHNLGRFRPSHRDGQLGSSERPLQRALCVIAAGILVRIRDLDDVPLSVRGGQLGGLGRVPWSARCAWWPRSAFSCGIMITVTFPSSHPRTVSLAPRKGHLSARSA